MTFIQSLKHPLAGILFQGYSTSQWRSPKKETQALIKEPNVMELVAEKRNAWAEHNAILPHNLNQQLPGNKIVPVSAWGNTSNKHLNEPQKQRVSKFRTNALAIRIGGNMAPRTARLGTYTCSNYRFLLTHKKRKDNYFKKNGFATTDLILHVRAQARPISSAISGLKRQRAWILCSTFPLGLHSESDYKCKHARCKVQ